MIIYELFIGWGNKKRGQTAVIHAVVRDISIMISELESINIISEKLCFLNVLPTLIPMM